MDNEHRKSLKPPPSPVNNGDISTGGDFQPPFAWCWKPVNLMGLFTILVSRIFVHQQYEVFLLKSVCIEPSLWSSSLKAGTHSLIHPGCGSKMIDLPKKWLIFQCLGKRFPPKKNGNILHTKLCWSKPKKIQLESVPLFSKELFFSYTKLTSLSTRWIPKLSYT